MQDAATRRKPLQEKTRIGTSVETFRRDIEVGAGHVGLPECMAMIGAAIGWELDVIKELTDPVVVDRAIESEFLSVEEDEVAGIQQTGQDLVGNEPVIELELRMALGVSKPRDRVSISGIPDLEVTTTGGFHDDITTPAILVNYARRVLNAEPELTTVIELPPGG